MERPFTFAGRATDQRHPLGHHLVVLLSRLFGEHRIASVRDRTEQVPDRPVGVEVLEHRACTQKSFLTGGVPPCRLIANLFRKQRERNALHAADEELLLALEAAIQRSLGDPELAGELVETYTVVPALGEAQRGVFEDAPAERISVVLDVAFGFLHPRAREVSANAREGPASFAERADLPQLHEVVRS